MLVNKPEPHHFLRASKTKNYMIYKITLKTSSDWTDVLIHPDINNNPYAFFEFHPSEQIVFRDQYENLALISMSRSYLMFHGVRRQTTNGEATLFIESSSNQIRFRIGKGDIGATTIENNFGIISHNFIIDHNNNYKDFDFPLV